MVVESAGYDSLAPRSGDMALYYYSEYDAKGPHISMERFLAIVCLALSSFCSLSYAQLQSCSASKEQAETQAGTVSSWDALYSWYRVYRNCDDGVIAETSSAAVGGLLAGRWNTLPRLGLLARRDPGFRQFVLKHFGWTIEMQDIEPKDVEAIKRKARKQCPAELHGLCSDLWNVADTALRVSNSPQ